MDEIYIVKLPVSQTDQSNSEVTLINCCLVSRLLNLEYFQNFFILESTWKTDFVNLSIINGNEQLIGKIQFELFQNISSSLEIDYNTFLSETKTAITTNNGAPMFSYYINEEELIWKKEGSRNLKIIYGKTSLQKSEIINNMLFNSTDTINNLQSQIIQYKQDLVTGLDEINAVKKLLKQTTEAKEINEKELYTKFICLLNSKKLKINELKSSLVQKQKLSSPDNSSEEDNLNKTVVERCSDSSEDSSMIPILPKRRKFQPIIKVIKTAEKETEVVSSQKSSGDSEDLFKDM